MAELISKGHGSGAIHVEYLDYGDSQDPSPALNAKLINPFLDADEEDMEALITNFLVETEIDNDDPEARDYIRRGAFLAQDPASVVKKRHGRSKSVSLTNDEASAINSEAANKWRQPWILYALVACCSLGAAVQGWDETSINQVALSAYKRLTAQLWFGSSFDQLVPNSKDFTWKLGLVSSAPYLCCAFVGCWLTDPLNYFLGRRGTIFVCCAISWMTCLGQAASTRWYQLFITRFLLGLGLGPKSTTVPIYAAECSPKEIRGALVMMWQMCELMLMFRLNRTAFGIMLGIIAGEIFSHVQSDVWKWRLTIGSPMILPLLVCAVIFFLPESPRWLVQRAMRNKKHRSCYKSAFKTLKRLRQTNLQAARDLFLMYHLLRNEENITRYRNRFADLIFIPRNRRALVASLILMFMQQFCGVNVLAYYSSTVFVKAGWCPFTAVKFTLGFGLLNFLFAIPAALSIDTFGRRGLLLLTFPFMALFHLWTSLAFLAPPGTDFPLVPTGKHPACRQGGTTQNILVAVGIYLFAVAYSPGEGPVPFVYASEAFPLYVRELGMSLAVATTWLFNWVLAFTLPKFLDAFKPEGTFGYYAGWCLVGELLIFWAVPETKGQDLESMDAIFSVPTSHNVHRSWKEARYFVRRWVWWDKTAQRPRPRTKFASPATMAESGFRNEHKFSSGEPETRITRFTSVADTSAITRSSRDGASSVSPAANSPRPRTEQGSDYGPPPGNELGLAEVRSRTREWVG